jgi:hypothetical protein
MTAYEKTTKRCVSVKVLNMGLLETTATAPHRGRKLARKNETKRVATYMVANVGQRLVLRNRWELKL